MGLNLATSAVGGQSGKLHRLPDSCGGYGRSRGRGEEAGMRLRRVGPNIGVGSSGRSTHQQLCRHACGQSQHRSLTCTACSAEIVSPLLCCAGGSYSLGHHASWHAPPLGAPYARNGHALPHCIPAGGSGLSSLPCYISACVSNVAWSIHAWSIHEHLGDLVAVSG